MGGGDLTEERTIRDYQREISRVARPLRLVEDLDGEPPRTRESAFLELEGWSYKIRRGKRIWCRDEDDPWSGWVSEEEAYRRVSEAQEGEK
jgi:hypothetical protein